MDQLLLGYFCLSLLNETGSMRHHHMWIKAYPGCLYGVVLGSKRALEPALFSAPIGVAVGGDSDQLTRGE